MELIDVRYIGSNGQYQAYSPQDVALINTALITANFGGPNDYIEYFIKDLNKTVLSSNYYATQYNIGSNVNSVTATTTTLFLNPEADAKAAGYTRGIVDVKYNFFTKQLLSSPDPEQNFWIKEISTSRTEIKVARQDLSNTQLANTFAAFNATLSADAYYPTFYLNFGNDIQIIGVNAVYVEEEGNSYIIFKLYEPLPIEFDTKTTFWVVTLAANPAEFNVSINVTPQTITDTVGIKGPNFKVAIADKINQTTPYYTYANLFSTSVTSSFQQLKSMMAEKGIQINVDYSNFENFIHFSSATERLHNYVYKLQLIESASAGLNQTNTDTAKVLLQAQIDNTITNFDGWEYYLYFDSGSTSWPKQNNTSPYALYSVTSSEAINWLGSPTIYPTPATMSMYWSSSYYDDQNKNWLIYATPQYILDDDTNAPYLVFLDMIGQHFDNIWIYLKDVTNRYSAENNPFVGISMDQVSEALKSFGVQLYTNTSITDNLYYSLLGLNGTGSNLPVTSSTYSTVVYQSSSIYPLAGEPYLTASLFLPPFGEEKIERYVLTFPSASTTVTASFETLPSQQLTDEIYKRLYHNLPYLLKTRGTERGVKALIATYGVPADILTVHEYGGYNYLEVPGIQEISNTRILTGSVLQISSSLLSPFATIQYYDNNLEKTSISVEVGFSPADSINASITSSGYVTSSTQPGYFNIMQLIGNPALQYSSSYIPLEQLSNIYFSAEYTSRYNVWDFIRLIKFYNNSLFKMLRDWVPARTSADTGIVIKSHMLERNKYPRKEPTYTTSSYDADYELLILSGSDGGTVVGNTNYIQSIPIQYNGTASIALTASFGTVFVSSSNDIQKFTGEFSGSYINVTTNYFPQEEISSYIFPWTSSTPGNNGLFLSYSLSPLYQNVLTPVRSQRFLDLDYNTTQFTPVNYGLITKSMQDTVLYGNVVQSQQPYSQYAYIQDFNYSSRAYTIPRYSGSYLSGQYNTASAGDISFNNEPVIDYYTNKIGFFTQVASSSFLPGKTNVVLTYLADVSGGLFELNQNNRNWIDVQNIFVAGTTATVKQFDNKKFSNQVTTDGIKTIYNSGYNYTPQLYFTSGADSRIFFQYVASEVTSPFRGFVSGSPNSFISGTVSPHYRTTLDTGTAVRRGVIYNYLDGENPVSSDFATGSAGVWPSYTTSIAGQRTFTINLGLNVEFPNPQTFGNQSIQYSWGAYKNGNTLIGSVQNLDFNSQYSAGGATTGSIIGTNLVNTSFEIINSTGLDDGTINGPFNVIINGVNQGTVNGSITYGQYVYWYGTGPTQVGVFASSATGDIASYINILDMVLCPGPSCTPPTLLQTYIGGGGAGTPLNISGSLLNLNYTTPAVSLSTGDKVEFRFTQSFVTTDNFTASFLPGISNSYLVSQPVAVGQGGYPYATVSSSGFINNIVDTTPNTSTIYFNNELSTYNNYQFVPAFISGGALYTGSLYNLYGDVNYPLNPQFGDKVVMSDYSGVIQELDVVSGSVVNGTLNVIVTPQVLDNWMLDPKQIYTFLLLRRYQDEQNIILSFTKTPGQTSYGFLIPDTVSPQLINNINTLQATVQSQLLVNQSVPPIDTINGGSFGG
jgi:hypothetical protein